MSAGRARQQEERAAAASPNSGHGAAAQPKHAAATGLFGRSHTRHPAAQRCLHSSALRLVFPGSAKRVGPLTCQSRCGPAAGAARAAARAPAARCARLRWAGGGPGACCTWCPTPPCRCPATPEGWSRASEREGKGGARERRRVALGVHNQCVAGQPLPERSRAEGQRASSRTQTHSTEGRQRHDAGSPRQRACRPGPAGARARGPAWRRSTGPGSPPAPRCAAACCTHARGAPKAHAQLVSAFAPDPTWSGSEFCQRGSGTPKRHRGRAQTLSARPDECSATGRTPMLRKEGSAGSAARVTGVAAAGCRRTGLHTGLHAAHTRARAGSARPHTVAATAHAPRPRAPAGDALGCGACVHDHCVEQPNAHARERRGSSATATDDDMPRLAWQDNLRRRRCLAAGKPTAVPSPTERQLPQAGACCCQALSPRRGAPAAARAHVHGHQASPRRGCKATVHRSLRCPVWGVPSGLWRTCCTTTTWAALHPRTCT